MILLSFTFKESIERKKHHLDYLGTVTLTGSIVALLFALLQGGTTWAWISFQSIGLFVASIVLFILFIRTEQRAAEPILPLVLFKNRIIAIASIGGVVIGVLLFGITSYVPLFVQGVNGGTATSAGLTLGPLLLAWPITSSISGKIAIRYGYRITAVSGMVLATIGAIMTILFNPQTSLAFIIVAMVFIGAGLGFVSTVSLLSVQNAVPWNLRGVATASTQFFRTMGGTVSVAIMGTILNAQMASRFAPIYAQFASIANRLPKNIAPANVLLTPELRASLPSAFLAQLQLALSQSLFWVYSLMLILTIAGLVTMFLLPAGRADRYAYTPTEEEIASTPESASESLANIG